MDYLAHSSNDGHPAQSYAEHVNNVSKLAETFAYDAAKYSVLDSDLLIHAALVSSLLHDLGKLNRDNQDALHSVSNTKKLPVNHVDAGVALLQCGEGEDSLSAYTVFSHHRGLPDYYSDKAFLSRGYKLRDPEVERMTNSEVESLFKLHQSLVKKDIELECGKSPKGDRSVFQRILLSCLVDADHTDTGNHYGQYIKDTSPIELRPNERLALLDKNIQKKKKDDPRNKLRSEMYDNCRNKAASGQIIACDSPVGSGKTTAIMAHALKQAAARNARHIFVILPYTNIITQSVKEYRETITLPGEDPEEVVAELHHLADFEDANVRMLSSRWKAPIIVTTAVAFFETLASNKPSTLRKLHELPGSVIFIDESHSALPLKLMPLAWKWIRILADEWNCYWILASGSLVKYWTYDEIEPGNINIPQLVNDELRSRLLNYENHRVAYEYLNRPLSRSELVQHVLSVPGPRLVIMNTVQSAAVIAKDFWDEFGQDSNTTLNKSRVLHISTALTPEDRELVLSIVRNRLEKEKDNSDWVLVATSCVEAGQNLSFHNSFREIASLLSLIQISGRTSRNGEYTDSTVWSFSMQDDPLLSKNHGLDDSAYVLRNRILPREEISPELCTKAIRLELNRISAGEDPAFKHLVRAENSLSFQTVQEEFKVFENDTVLVVPDPSLASRITSGYTNWKEIQKKTVSISRSKLRGLNLPMLATGLYQWTLKYDHFLGVMAGILDELHAKEDTLFI